MTLEDCQISPLFNQNLNLVEIYIPDSLQERAIFLLTLFKHRLAFSSHKLENSTIIQWLI